MKMKRNTKRYNRAPRRRKTQRHKKRTSLKKMHRSSNMRGGMVFDKSDEGCAFWPSIINEHGEDPDKTVTKIFFSPAAGGMQREAAKYALFDKYDKAYLYHARLISAGDCTKEVMKDISPECYRKTAQYTNYINTEYVGKNVRDNPVNSSDFYLGLIDFYDKVLDLQENGGFYLINSENHSGNICYNDRNQFKYIDLGGVETKYAHLPITDAELVGRINMQFSNIKGGLFPLGAYDLTFAPMALGMTYMEYLDTFKRTFLDPIKTRARNLSGSSSPSSSSRSSSSSSSVFARPVKNNAPRSRLFARDDEPISGIGRGLSMFGDDSPDDTSRNSDRNKKSDRDRDRDRDRNDKIPIDQSDIMYQDDLVCILRPEVKKGILVYSNYTQPSGMPSLCDVGLKTGKQLHDEGVDFGRIVYHPYIFFRAPFYSHKVEYSSIETEITSSFGPGQMALGPRVWIRVDPDRTFVFSSEIRAKYYGSQSQSVIENSKKTLTQYLKIIDANVAIETNVPSYKKVWYNLFSSKAVLFPETADPNEITERIVYDDNDINVSSEILVRIPHLTPDYFVFCTK
jgi:hypothetical protein